MSSCKSTRHFLSNKILQNTAMEMINISKTAKDDDASGGDPLEEKIVFDTRTFKQIQQLKRQNKRLQVVAISAVVLLALTLLVFLIVFFSDRILKKEQDLKEADATIAFLQRRTVSLLSNRSSLPVQIRCKVPSPGHPTCLARCQTMMTSFSILHTEYCDAIRDYKVSRWSLDAEGRLAGMDFSPIHYYPQHYSTEHVVELGPNWQCVARYANYSISYEASVNERLGDFTDCSNHSAARFELRVEEQTFLLRRRPATSQPTGSSSFPVFFTFRSKEQPNLCLTCPGGKCQANGADKVYWNRCAVESALPPAMVNENQLFYLHGEDVDYSRSSV